MSVLSKLKRAVRGDVKPTTAALEVLRRTRVSLARKREMRSLDIIANRPARLQDRFGQMNAEQLLAHFRNRTEPKFFAGFRDPATPKIQQQSFPTETFNLLLSARKICDQQRWSLLGYEEQYFGDEIQWRRDPISGYVSPLAYHCEVELIRNDGSDARVLWELNRLGHFLTLGRAYAVSEDEKLATEFFKQIKSWSDQNPYGKGPNWHCAMEVALRAINLLSSFELFRQSPQLTAESLSHLLALLDQHGTYIRNNLEFSYLATSNHYFSDVVGLLWLGIMLPELRYADEWREFGFREMLREIDKQISPDGSDFESSTGYHRFVLELILYSFLLCRQNEIQISENYWQTLRKMLEYVRCYMRPDGLAPLIGDTDGGQVMPIAQRVANDHAYVLKAGAVVFNDPLLKSGDASEEVLWLFGGSGLKAFEDLPGNAPEPESASFPDAGLHILRHNDLYLCFNASDVGLDGRGSHAHNDVMSVEISACGRAFIVDPGTFVYTGDLLSRHKFRSTAFHSTAQVDDDEQNTINTNVPFVIGNEAGPVITFWETGAEFDRVTAEHSGYRRLRGPLTHRRAVTFNKGNRSWSIEDELIGNDEHKLAIRFHFDAGLEVSRDEGMVIALDKSSGAKLIILSITLASEPTLEVQATSRHYGQKEESIAACWKTTQKDAKLSWLIVPVCAGENEQERLQLCRDGSVTRD
jgi:hypothetical protein